MTRTNLSGFISSLMIAGAACLACPTASALPSSTFTRQSVLTQNGHWVKVKVTSTGVQAISYDQLREWGFSRPSAVRVYGFAGVELAHNTFSQSSPDDLPMQYSEHANNRLFFYGEADWRTMLSALDFSAANQLERLTLDQKRDYYAPYSTYFLTDAAVGQQPDDTASYNSGNTADPVLTHQSLVYIEPEEENFGQGGTMFYSSPILDGEPRVVTFPVTDAYMTPVDPDDESAGECGTAYLNYLNVGKTRAQMTIVPSIAGIASRNGKYDFPTPLLPTQTEFDNTYLSPYPLPSYVSLSLNAPLGEVYATFTKPDVWNLYTYALDYAALVYERRNRLPSDGSQLELNYAGRLTTDGNIVFENAASSTMRVWDVSVPLSVTPLAIGQSDGLAAVTPVNSGAVRLVAFNTTSGSLATPEFVADVTGTCPNLHGSSGDIDLLVVTVPSLRAEAERIAAAHRAHQGLAVDVAVTTDIYNEFSSGAPSAIAIHRYAKMLYDRGNKKLRYLLLMGTGNFDNRQITQVTDDPLPSYQCEEWRDDPKNWCNMSTTNFSSDIYYGMLADDFDPRELPNTCVDLGVGRIPASSAEAMAQKVEDYLSLPPDALARSRAIMIADYNDDNAHMLMAEANLEKIATPGIMESKIYMGAYDISTKPYTDVLREALASAPGFIGYTGHGSQIGLGMGLIWTVGNTGQMKFNSYPVAYFATCNALVLDRAGTSFGEMLLKTNPGPVGVISSGRTVYLDRNGYPFDGFTKSWFAAQPGDAVGDAWRDAFNYVQTNHVAESIGINTLCYNLAGDPALPIPATIYGGRLDGFGEGTVTTAESLQPVTLTGAVTDADGNVVTSFNGPATVTLLDGRTTQTTLGYDNSEQLTFDVDDRILAMAGTDVVDGLWSVTLTPPVPMVTGSVNTVMLSATDSLTGSLAMAKWGALNVTDPQEGSEVADADAPVVEEMYLNSPAFADGDIVGPSVVLHARIAADASGLAVAGGQIGRRPSVLLDGTTSFPTAGQGLRYEADGSAVLTLYIDGLSDGYHSLRLNVADNAGNVASRRIGFAVQATGLSGQLTASHEVAYEGQVDLDVTTSASATVTRIVVEDADGNTVHTAENPALPLTIDTAALPDGLYRAFGWLKSDTQWGRTNNLEFTVINPAD